MARDDFSILNIINQSDAFIDHFENGATFGGIILANWNLIFFDLQILLVLFLLIDIWPKYFYQVNFKFYKKNIEKKIMKNLETGRPCRFNGCAKKCSKKSTKTISN